MTDGLRKIVRTPRRDGSVTGDAARVDDAAKAERRHLSLAETAFVDSALFAERILGSDLSL
jgi:hypothetical protein